MPALQDVIHEVEVGRGTRFLKLGVVVLTVLGVIIFYNWKCYRNMATQEAMDMAQLGRNIAQGKGYTTLFIRPFSTYLLKQHNQAKPGALQGKVTDLTQVKDAHPDIANPPVYPVLLAVLMKVLPFDYAISGKPRAFWAEGGQFLRFQPDFLISIFNQLLFFGTLVLIFFLVRRVFEARVAWTTTAILFGTEILWRFCTSGLSTMLLLLIFVCLAWCLVLIEQETLQPEPRSGRLILLAVGAGCLVALGCLTRYAFGWLMVPLLLAIFFFAGPRRILLAGIALALFLVVVAPWVVRNYQVSGTPFGTAGYAFLETTPSFPEFRLQRSIDPDLNVPFLKPFTQKLLNNSRHILETDIPRLGGGWISSLFLVGLLVSFAQLTARRFRYFILMCLCALAVAQALGHTQLSEDSPEINSENLLVLLAPFVVAYGVSLFYLFLDQLDFPLRELRYAALGAFGALACMPMIFAFLPPRTVPVVYPPYHPPSLQRAAEFTRPGELTMTDVPWAMAWYGQRKSIWLGLNIQDFFAVSDYQKPIEELFLTPLTGDSRLFTALSESWGILFLQCHMNVFSNPDLWPRSVNLPVGQERGNPGFFPLHYWQKLDYPSQLLLTSRENPVGPP